MSFKNLYALLGVAPTASDTEIVKAMREMAQLQLIELDDLKLCKATLLNPEERKKYNAQLFAEHPEVLGELTKPKETEEVKPPPPKKTTRSKKKLYVILASVVAAGVVAGAVVYFKHYKPLWEAKDAVRDILKDPDSAKFYNVKRLVNSKNELLSVCGQVNARVPAGGYGGKQLFVYLVKTKKAMLIPSKRPESIGKEYFYSTMYRINCLNADPDELAKQSAEAIARSVEYEKLASEREVTSIYDIEYDRLDKEMVEMAGKMEEDRQAISIFSDSDDE
ncbi:hypothetical protein [Snodgrassella gandavensis]|uniref:hypothetical protein n=1 Tax=Snodgrassella gandavensis TaxID=2946698 RepID=UPI001EF4D4DA|nr:hypothetical protein [Snodgrassella gandavensis]